MPYPSLRMENGCACADESVRPTQILPAHRDTLDILGAVEPAGISSATPQDRLFDCACAFASLAHLLRSG